MYCVTDYKPVNIIKYTCACITGIYCPFYNAVVIANVTFFPYSSTLLITPTITCQMHYTIFIDKYTL